MDRRDLFSLSAVTALTFALLPSSAVGQQKPSKDQLVGTWTLVSTDNTQNFGANPKGMLVFDGNGRYSLVFMRSDLPKFAASAADKGTAEENYTVNEADKTITSRAEGSWFPNQVGTEAKRIITSLTADELKYTNPATALGTTAHTVWRRGK